MKKNEVKGSLLSLFAKSYMGFSLAVFILAGLMYLGWNNYYEHLMSVPYSFGITEDENLQSEKYENLKVSKYLGNDGGIEVLDENCNIVYVSSEEFRIPITKNELACIHDSDGNMFYECTPIAREDGELNYLITQTLYTEDGDFEYENYIVTDSNYSIISGKFVDDRKEFSEKEIEYLSGNLGETKEISKYSFVSEKTGAQMNLLMISTKWTLDTYNDNMARANRMWLLFIPSYLFITILFIFLLNKRIKKPLYRLNETINGFSVDSDVRFGKVEGPSEIVSIGKSFDNMADMLRESEQARKKLDDDRRSLVMDISHDLKTPITVISGYTKAIRDGKVPPEELEHYLEAIDTKAQNLNELVNTFHEYSKVDHLAFSIETETEDICEYMRKYLADKYDEIDLSGFYLEANIPERSVKVKLDKSSFKRALDNIIANSVKHNRLGTLLYVGIETDKKYVYIILADNGIGISPENSPRIFDPFVMGDESRSRGGSGLGLSITQKIIRAHGGQIVICIPPEQGFSTEFKIRLLIVD